MKRLSFFIILIYLFSACHQNENIKNHGHDHGEEKTYNENENKNEQLEVSEVHTIFNENYELFVEFSPLIKGEESEFLAHFTKLSNYKPVLSGTLQLVLEVENSKTEIKVDAPIRPGIFKPVIVPEVTGNGKLYFILNTENKTDKVIITSIQVFPNRHEAEHVLGSMPHPEGISYLKEQAWQIEFATEEIKPGNFNNIIKSSGEILSSQNDENHLTSPASGNFYFNEAILKNGVFVQEGQVLGFVSDENLSEENSYKKYIKASAEFEKAKADFERAEKLIDEKIISQEKYQEYKLNYEKTKVEYNILNTNFSKKGIAVKAKTTGNIKEIFVLAGEYVNTGDVLVCIAKNQKIIIRSDVSQEYFNELQYITTMSFKVPGNNLIFDLGNYNGKLISYAKNKYDGYLIPVYFELDNPGNLFVGSFVETYLIGKELNNVLTIPNSAVLEAQGTYFVYVQLAGETFEKRDITPSYSDGKRTLISKGLKAGERVVTKGAIRIKLASSGGSLPAHGHAH